MKWRSGRGVGQLQDTFSTDAAQLQYALSEDTSRILAFISDELTAIRVRNNKIVTRIITIETNKPTGPTRTIL